MNITKALVLLRRAKQPRQPRHSRQRRQRRGGSGSGSLRPRASSVSSSCSAGIGAAAKVPQRFREGCAKVLQII